MTSTKNPFKPLRDVLYDFSLAQEVPDADLLDEYAKLYPIYATELTDFAINMFVDAKQGAEKATQAFEEESVSPAVSRAMSAFQVALQESRGQQESVANEGAVKKEVENPFTSLERKEFRALAKSMNANLAFLCKLRDGLIAPQTMPQGFLRFLGDKMGTSVGQLEAFFGGKAPRFAGQHFKAEVKPTVGDQQSFEDAVKSSGLTDEQQQFLREL